MGETPKDHDLERLIFQSVAGDQKAFAQLVQRYHNRLHFYIARLIHDADHAEDILQEVWMAAYRQLPKLRSAEAFQVWIYQIARNQAMRSLRGKLKNALRFESLETLSEELPEPELALSKADAALINQALEQLKPIHREVLVLRFMEDMSYQEIAEVINCNLGTVKSRMHLAKQALAERLEALRS